MPNETDPASWRRWLTERMNEAGLDAAGVAARNAGWLTAEMVQGVLTGEVRIQPQLAIDIAQALGVPTSEAVAAAGWLDLAASMASVRKGQPTPNTVYMTVEEILELPLPEDVLRGLLGRIGYGLPDFMPAPDPADGDEPAG